MTAEWFEVQWKGRERKGIEGNTKKQKELGAQYDK
jgi:hypothetical protein